MNKLELLSRIQTLSSIAHNPDITAWNLNEATIVDIHRLLNELTEQYIDLYCQAA